MSLEKRGLLNFASWMLIGSLLVMPLGFFLGGLFLLGGEPGIGIFLVPIGAFMMLFAVAAIVFSLRWPDGGAAKHVDRSTSTAKPRKKNPRRP